MAPLEESNSNLFPKLKQGSASIDSSAPSSSHLTPLSDVNVTFIHPDLGIGGAERLVIDAALSLKNIGAKITIYTSYRDTGHCFEEARDGTLDVRVRGGEIVPASINGRGRVVCAAARQIALVFQLVREFSREGRGSKNGKKEVFFVDQMPICVPILRLIGSVLGWNNMRTLFYCHFPDQLLAQRNESGIVLRFAKSIYRIPFDWLEGWAISCADQVIANSSFTRGVIRQVFGGDLGSVDVVYPAVDTRIKSEPERLWGKKILLSINRFERKKNIGLAIRAYNGMSVKYREGTRLVIAGGYDPREAENVRYHIELNDLARAFGLQTATAKTVPSALSIPDKIDVLFLLSVPSAFRETLLASSSILLYTPANEHFGIVPVEAMRAGCPVLATNTGGPLETIVDGVTGWLRGTHALPAWTSVLRYAIWEMSDSERQEMQCKGKERVQELFSLDAMGSRFEEEINRMLNQPNRGIPLNGSAIAGIVGIGSLVILFLAVFLALTTK